MRWRAWRGRGARPVTWTARAGSWPGRSSDPAGGRRRWPTWRRRRRTPVTWTGRRRWPSRPRQQPAISQALAAVAWQLAVAARAVTWTGPGAGPRSRPVSAGAAAGGLAGWRPGDLDRAQALARAITNPDAQARALAGWRRRRRAR